MSKKIYPSGFLELKKNFAKKFDELKGQVEPGVKTRIISLLDLAGESAQKLKAPLKEGNQLSLDVLDEFRDEINKIIDKEIEGVNEAINNSDQTKDDEQQKGEKARKEAREQLIKNKAIWEQLKQNAEEINRWFKEDIGKTATPASGTPSIEIPAEEQKSESRAPTTEDLFRVMDATYGNRPPTAPTTFTITESWKVTHLWTYHSKIANEYEYPKPGTIGLRSADGTTYGPWQAHAETGQEWYWDAYPNAVIPPGTYTVLDSGPETWISQKSGEGQAVGEGIRSKFLTVS